MEMPLSWLLVQMLLGALAARSLCGGHSVVARGVRAAAEGGDRPSWGLEGVLATEQGVLTTEQGGVSSGQLAHTRARSSVLCSSCGF